MTRLANNPRGNRLTVCGAFRRNDPVQRWIEIAISPIFEAAVTFRTVNPRDV